MKAGIVADNYKVPMFKEALTAAGLTFKTDPFTNGTTAITVNCRQDQLEQVHAICVKIQGAALRKKQGEN